MRAIATVVLALSTIAAAQSQPASPPGSSPPATASAAPKSGESAPVTVTQTNPASPPPAAPVTVPQTLNLLFMRRVWTLGPAMQYACFEVTRDGAYRLEVDTSSPSRSRITAKVHAGKLSQSDLQEFEKLLDDPALKSLTLPAISPQQNKLTSGFAGLDVLTINIHRDDGVQRLFFDDASRGPQSGTDPFPASYNTPAMKPLLDWYYRIDQQQNDVVSGAAPGCAKRIRE